MKKLLISAILLLAGCASLVSLFGSPRYDYCGKVDLLSVFVKSESLITCVEALTITNQAYEILWQKAAAPLNEPWRVEYTWGVIDYSDPWAKTVPSERLIKIQSSARESILHELLHAYMFESETGGTSHHRKMCANKLWRQLEDSFGVRPYCHLLSSE